MPPDPTLAAARIWQNWARHYCLACYWILPESEGVVDTHRSSTRCLPSLFAGRSVFPFRFYIIFFLFFLSPV